MFPAPTTILDRQLTRTVLFFAPLCSLLVNLGQSVLFATMPVLGRILGFHEVQITALVSLSALTFFLVSPIWGRYSDVLGRKRTMLIGLSAYSLGALLFNGIVELAFAGFLGGWVLYMLLLPYRVAHTGMMAAVHPASGAYVADVTSVQERTAGMSQLAAAVALGAILGPPLVYFSRYGILTPLYISALISLCGTLWLWLSMPDYRVPKEDENAPPVRLSYFDPRYRTFLLIGLVMYSAMSAAQQTLGFYLQDRFGFDNDQTIRNFAIANMVSSAAMMFAQLVLVRRMGWDASTLLHIGLPLACLGYFGLAAVGIFYVDLDTALRFLFLCAAMLVFGLGMGLAGPGYTASASLRVGSQEQGALAGLSASIPGLGFVIGPIVGGVLYSVNSFYPYLLSGALLLALTVFVWRSLKV